MADSETAFDKFEVGRDVPNKPLDKAGNRSSSESEAESMSETVPHPQVEKQTTPAIVPTLPDWDGPDDPGDPRNWPMWKKVYHTIVVGLIGFGVTIASSIYTPAYPEVARHFHISPTTALLGLTIYVLGLAFGPVVSAPISETFGRDVIYKVTIPISLLFTLGASQSHSYAAFLVCRFLAAFSGSAVLAVGGGTNVDIWPLEKRAIATSLFLVAPFLGPSLGPTIGGFVAQYKNWRWTQYCILFLGVFLYILVLFTQETYKKIILRRRVAKLRKQNNGNEDAAQPPTPAPKQSAVQIAKFFLTITLFRPIHMLMFEPIVTYLSIYTAFGFSLLFCFFASIPYVFQRPPYTFTVSQTGLVFLAVGLGVVIAGGTSILIDRLLYQKKHIKALKQGRGAVAPEHRLYAAMMGCFGIPIGIFWFGWCADKGTHWAWLVVATIPFAWGNLSLFTSTALYVVDVYGPLNGASALAANGILRYTLGAVFPLFTVQMYEKLGSGWASSLLGFISVAMIPIPWVLFKYGEKIRAKSRYDTVKF